MIYLQTFINGTHFIYTLLQILRVKGHDRMHINITDGLVPLWWDWWNAPRSATACVDYTAGSWRWSAATAALPPPPRARRRTSELHPSANKEKGNIVRHFYNTCQYICPHNRPFIAPFAHLQRSVRKCAESRVTCFSWGHKLGGTPGGKCPAQMAQCLSLLVKIPGYCLREWESSAKGESHSGSRACHLED